MNAGGGSTRGRITVLLNWSIKCFLWARSYGKHYPKILLADAEIGTVTSALEFKA